MIKPIDVPLHPSRLLLAVLATAHVLALIVIWVLLPGWSWANWTMKSGLSALVIVSLLLTLKQSLRPKIVALRVNIKGSFSIQQRDGGWQEAALLGSSFIAPYLTVLNLRLPGRRWPQHVVLVPDAVQKDAFRRLRVWLRWGQS